MGMSTFVYGFKKPDEEYFKMAEAYHACKKARVQIPEAVETFFEYEEPDIRGVPIRFGHDLTDNDEFPKGVYKVQPSEMTVGFEIALDELDSEIRVIRFVNSF